MGFWGDVVSEITSGGSAVTDTFNGGNTTSGGNGGNGGNGDSDQGKFTDSRAALEAAGYTVSPDGSSVFNEDGQVAGSNWSGSSTVDSIVAGSGGDGDSGGSSGVVSVSVVSGDSLSKIAAANNTTLGAIKALNPGIDINNIQIGQKISLTPNSRGADESIYTGVTQAELAAGNALVAAADTASTNASGITADDTAAVDNNVYDPETGFEIMTVTGGDFDGVRYLVDEDGVWQGTLPMETTVAQEFGDTSYIGGVETVGRDLDADLGAGGSDFTVTAADLAAGTGTVTLPSSGGGNVVLSDNLGNVVYDDLLQEIINTGDVEGSVDNLLGVGTDINLPGALTNIADTSDTSALPVSDVKDKVAPAGLESTGLAPDSINPFLTIDELGTVPFSNQVGADRDVTQGRGTMVNGETYVLFSDGVVTDLQGLSVSPSIEAEVKNKLDFSAADLAADTAEFDAVLSGGVSPSRLEELKGYAESIPGGYTEEDLDAAGFTAAEIAAFEQGLDTSTLTDQDILDLTDQYGDPADQGQSSLEVSANNLADAARLATGTYIPGIFTGIGQGLQGLDIQKDQALRAIENSLADETYSESEYALASGADTSGNLVLDDPIITKAKNFVSYQQGLLGISGDFVSSIGDTIQAEILTPEEIAQKNTSAILGTLPQDLEVDGTTLGVALQIGQEVGEEALDLAVMMMTRNPLVLGAVGAIGAGEAAAGAKQQAEGAIQTLYNEGKLQNNPTYLSVVKAIGEDAALDFLANEVLASSILAVSATGATDAAIKGKIGKALGEGAQEVAESGFVSNAVNDVLGLTGDNQLNIFQDASGNFVTGAITGGLAAVTTDAGGAVANSVSNLNNYNNAVNNTVTSTQADTLPDELQTEGLNNQDSDKTASELITQADTLPDELQTEGLNNQTSGKTASELIREDDPDELANEGLNNQGSDTFSSLTNLQNTNVSLQSTTGDNVVLRNDNTGLEVTVSKTDFEQNQLGIINAVNANDDLTVKELSPGATVVDVNLNDLDAEDDAASLTELSFQGSQSLLSALQNADMKTLDDGNNNVDPNAVDPNQPLDKTASELIREDDPDAVDPNAVDPNDAAAALALQQQNDAAAALALQQQEDAAAALALQQQEDAAAALANLDTAGTTTITANNDATVTNSTDGAVTVTTVTDGNGNATVTTNNSVTGERTTDSVLVDNTTTVTNGDVTIDVNAETDGTKTTVTEADPNVVVDPNAVVDPNVVAKTETETDINPLYVIEYDDLVTGDPETLPPVTEDPPIVTEELPLVTADPLDTLDTVEDEEELLEELEPVVDTEPDYVSGIAGIGERMRPVVAPYYQPLQTGLYSFYRPQAGVDQTPTAPVFNQPTSYLSPTGGLRYGNPYTGTNLDLARLRELAELQGTGAERLPSENLMDDL